MFFLKTRVVIWFVNISLRKKNQRVSTTALSCIIGTANSEYQKNLVYQLSFVNFPNAKCNILSNNETFKMIINFLAEDDLVKKT